MDYNVEVYVNETCVTHFGITDNDASVTFKIVNREELPFGPLFTYPSEIDALGLFLRDVRNLTTSDSDAERFGPILWEMSNQQEDYKHIENRMKAEVRRRGWCVKSGPRALSIENRNKLFQLLSGPGSCDVVPGHEPRCIPNPVMPKYD
jgi:hypothetical protein